MFHGLERAPLWFSKKNEGWGGVPFSSLFIFNPDLIVVYGISKQLILGHPSKLMSATNDKILPLWPNVFFLKGKSTVHQWIITKMILVKESSTTTEFPNRRVL